MDLLKPETQRQKCGYYSFKENTWILSKRIYTFQEPFTNILSRNLWGYPIEQFGIKSSAEVFGTYGAVVPNLLHIGCTWRSLKNTDTWLPPTVVLISFNSVRPEHQGFLSPCPHILMGSKGVLGMTENKYPKPLFLGSSGAEWAKESTKIIPISREPFSHDYGVFSPQKFR